MTADRRYWDSCCFLGYLGNEADKADKCEPVLSAAEDGHLEIVTSALTLTEVIRVKGAAAIPKDQEKKIRDFFEHSWIVVRDVDRFISEHARDLIWAHGLKPYDAIHLATALNLNLSLMDTFDGALLKLSGKLGSPRLVIEHPHITHTPDLFPEEKAVAKSHEKKPRKKRK